MVIKISLKYEDTNMCAIFEPEEFDKFKVLVQQFCESEDDVVGVLLTGSFAQNRKISTISKPIYLEREAKIYYDLCMKKSRKKISHRYSDLDVWVCTNDVCKDSDKIRATIDKRSITLINRMTSDSDLPVNEFVEMTGSLFNEFYKKDYLYSTAWRQKDVLPWMARPFKRKFLDVIVQSAHSINLVLEKYFGKNDLNDFVELRAYPISTFNLKPHLVRQDGIQSRNPMPYFIRDLVALERNCIILYADEKCEKLPYPFNPAGFLLGEAIANHIGWTTDHEEHLYAKRFMVR